MEELEPESDKDFPMRIHLNSLFHGYIIPSLHNKSDESIGSGLNAFRDKYCWTEHVNSIL